MNAVGRIAPAGVRRVHARRMALAAESAREADTANSSGSGEIRAPDIAGLRLENGVAALVDHAARLGASDLFFSFNDNHVAVSFRHLGIVRQDQQGRRALTSPKLPVTAVW